MYDWVMLIAILVATIPLMFREQSTLFYYFDVIPCGLFILDYILRWITADYRNPKRGAWAFVVYPFTIIAIIDLLSILPTFNFVKDAFKLTRIIRLLKFVRMVTALMMFNADQQINPNDGDYLFATFFDAFYWSACTLTTVGYGDIFPISTTGRVISILSSLVGIAIIALPSGIITAGFMDEINKEKTENKDDD